MKNNKINLSERRRGMVNILDIVSGSYKIVSSEEFINFFFGMALRSLICF